MPKIIIQRFGIGDVIHQMTAIRSLKDKILWPVLSEYVEGLNRAYPDIMFVDYQKFDLNYNIKERGRVNGFEILPMAWQDSPLKNCMDNKYRYLGRDPKTWKDNAHWCRDSKKEVELFNKLGLTFDEPFNLVNVKFGCWKGHNDLKPGINSITEPVINNGLRNVEMTIMPEFSIFDWTLVIQKATFIFTVSSSHIYLFELLKMEAKEIHIYIRRPNESSHENYAYLLQSHNYILEP